MNRSRRKIPGSPTGGTAVDAAAATALAILMIAPWIPSIARDAVPFFMDTLTQFYPWRRLVGILAKGGIAPWWNPSAFGGCPLLANPQVGVLYPGHWLFFLIPAGGMFTLTAAVHVAIGTVGVFVLLRQVGVSRVPAFAAGLAAGWNGWTWAHFAFGSYHQVWAWWPWEWAVLLGWTRQEGRGWPVAGVLLGLLTAMQLLAGAPQLVLYGGLAVFILLAIGWLSGPRPLSGSLRRYTAGAGIAAVLALGWSAPQLLPTSAYLRQCERTASLPVQEIQAGALSIKGLGQALLGGTGFPEDAESTAFFSSFWIALAGIGLVWGRARRVVWGFAGVALLGLLLSWRPLVGLWRWIVPGFSHMHDPRRALALVSATVPLLSGFGVDALLGRHNENKGSGTGRWMFFLALFAVVAIAGRLLLDLGRVPAPPEGLALQHAFGWAGSTEWMAGWGSVAATVAVIGAALGLRAGLRSDSVRRYAAGGLLCLWGGCVLFAFAVNRVDLKVLPVGEGEAVATRAEAVARRLAPATPESPSPLQRPIRCFAFDPTGHYSYDYTRPDAGEWLLPGLAALTWQAQHLPGTLGLCDLQGYDPALPRRFVALIRIVNEGHVALYPRHFALIRAPRSSLLPRLALDAAIGPIDRYVLPVLPNLLRPEETRRVPVEEPAPYARLRAETRMRPADARGTLDVALLDSGARSGLPARVLEEIKFTVRPGASGRGDWMDVSEAVSDKITAADSLGVAWHPHSEDTALSLLLALERDTIPPGLSSIDSVTSPPVARAPLSAPTPWKITRAFPYADVTRAVRPVPPAESPDTIGRLMARYPDAVVLEWPEDQAAPARFDPSKSEGPTGQVKRVEWRPGRVTLDVDIESPDGAAVVLREPWYAGWRVQVDERERAPMPADLAFQAVWVEPGTHRVVWLYRPVGFIPGVFLAVLSTILAAALVFRSRKKEKGREKTIPIAVDGDTDGSEFPRDQNPAEPTDP